MVRNEEKVILRVLESAKGVISAIALTDTGSTDRTIEVAEEWAKDNGLQIAIFREKWVNFGVSRTKSAMNGREFYPNADYLLLLDGDMVLRPQPNFNPDDLTANDYMIEQYNSGTHYYNTRLIDVKKFYRSVAGTHEYWGCPVGVRSGRFEDLKIDDMNDGGSRSDKHIRDINIMLEGMRKNVTPDYLIGRYSFYLGQTYQGVGNYTLSNFWYKKCASQGGWDQQVYYSLHQIGENYFRDGQFKKAIMYAFKAWDSRPSRAEPLLVLARSFACLNMKHMAKFYAELGKNIPTSTDVLFLDSKVYDGTKFDDVLNNLK